MRCFQIVNVEEPTPEFMCDMLESHRRRLAAHHGVVFEEMDLTAIARMVSICLRDRRLPDAAITVLDRAAARVGLRAAESPDMRPPVTHDDVVAVIAEMSGTPVARLSSSESERFLNLEPNGENLARIGQLFDQEKLETRVQKIYSLARAAEAHEVVEQGHVKGKLVLNL